MIGARIQAQVMATASPVTAKNASAKVAAYVYENEQVLQPSALSAISMS